MDSPGFLVGSRTLPARSGSDGSRKFALPLMKGQLRNNVYLSLVCGEPDRARAGSELQGGVDQGKLEELEVIEIIPADSALSS